MKNIIILLCLFGLNFGCGSEPQSEILSEQEFTKKFYEKVKSEFPRVDFEIKKDLEIHSQSGGNSSIKILDNAYKNYKKHPLIVERIFDRHINSMKEGFEIINENTEVTLDKVIPTIRHRSYLEQISAQLGDGSHGQIYEDYNQDLIIVYAIDNPRSIASLTQSDFTKFDIDYAELRKVAKENLFRIIGDQMGFEEKKGIFQLIAGGNFESSLILFPSLWVKENFNVKGEILISIPSRNKVLIFGSEDGETREMMKMVTKTSFKMDGHQISNKFFKWNPRTEIFEAEKY